MIPRSKVPVISSLLQYQKPLASLVAVAPHGFPSHACVRAALVAVHAAHGVFEETPARLVMKTAGEAADAWRILTKHLHACKVKDLQSPPELKVLLDGMKLVPPVAAAEEPAEAAAPTTAPTAAAAAATPVADAPLSAQDVQELFGEIPVLDTDDSEDGNGGDSDAGDDGVEVLFWVCRCESCLAINPAGILTEGVCDAVLSVISANAQRAPAAAAAQEQLVPAATATPAEQPATAATATQEQPADAAAQEGQPAQGAQPERQPEGPQKDANKQGKKD